MKKIAKFLSVVIVAATLAAVCTISASAAFRDVSAKDEALYEAVQLLNSLGIAKGQSDTTYGVNNPVTREQMAAFIYRLMKEGRSLEGGENTTPFTDLTDSTFFGMVSWASSNGIIVGRSETEFDPKGEISLQDCYVMITRALGYEKDGALNYPNEYIDTAERIGLAENIDTDIQYTDSLTRGQVAIILYNAFYADMNETYQEVFIPSFEDPNAAQEFVYIERNETVCHKIYGVEKVVRRVVATPSYGLDITALGDTAEYQDYRPTGGDTVDEDLIITAAIVPDENSNRLSEEESLISFEDLGLSGEADDYFLCDLVMYIKEDGTIIAASSSGKMVAESTASIENRAGTDLDRDYYYSGESDKLATNKTKLRSGIVSFGADKAYFYNKPSSVSNYAVSIYPYDSDEDGRISFKAGYTWSGAASPEFVEPDFTFGQNPVAYIEIQRKNHDKIPQVMSVAASSGRYNIQYYDSNIDGVVDYFWMQPFTFGTIVDKSGDSNTTKAKHTGDSANRAYFNSSKSMPEIYVRGATVVGGTCTNGAYAFAYVSGPGNYVRIAPDDLNNSITTFTSKVIRYNTEGGNEKNSSNWENGSVIHAWNSGNTIVGHVAHSGGKITGLVPLSSDNTNSEAFAKVWRDQLFIGDTWEIVQCGGRALLPKKLSNSVNIASEYAIIQYVDEDKLQVVFQAVGIDKDGSLIVENYVNAYIGGTMQTVKIAKLNDHSASGNQDDNYFVDEGLVNNICSFTVSSDEYYTFNPYTTGSEDAKASDLADKDNASLTYSVRVNNISLDKVQDKLYKFVPGASVASLPSSLTPNGMKYVNFTEDTKMVVNYVDEDGYSDFIVYDINNMPNFDATDPAMEFTNAVIVLRNNPNGTTTEDLGFLYCEIGGEIVDDSKSAEDYVIILGNIQTVDEDNKLINAYKVVDPRTGIVVDMKETAKASSAILNNFDLYELTETGDIKNTTGGKVASLAKGSSDLVTIDSFEADSNLLFVTGAEDALIVDEDTVYVLFDRATSTLTVEDSEMLSITAEDDEDDVYYNEGEDKLTAYIITEKMSDEDFKYANLVIVVRG